MKKHLNMNFWRSFLALIFWVLIFTQNCILSHGKLKQRKLRHPAKRLQFRINSFEALAQAVQEVQTQAQELALLGILSNPNEQSNEGVAYGGDSTNTDFQKRELDAASQIEPKNITGKANSFQRSEFYDIKTIPHEYCGNLMSNCNFECRKSIAEYAPNVQGLLLLDCIGQVVNMTMKGCLATFPTIWETTECFMEISGNNMALGDEKKFQLAHKALELILGEDPPNTINVTRSKCIASFTENPERFPIACALLADESSLINFQFALETRFENSVPECDNFVNLFGDLVYMFRIIKKSFEEYEYENGKEYEYEKQEYEYEEYENPEYEKEYEYEYENPEYEKEYEYEKTEYEYEEYENPEYENEYEYEKTEYEYEEYENPEYEQKNEYEKKEYEYEYEFENGSLPTAFIESPNSSPTVNETNANMLRSNVGKTERATSEYEYEYESNEYEYEYDQPEYEKENEHEKKKHENNESEYEYEHSEYEKEYEYENEYEEYERPEYEKEYEYEYEEHEYEEYENPEYEKEYEYEKNEYEEYENPEYENEYEYEYEENEYEEYEHPEYEKEYEYEEYEYEYEKDYGQLDESVADIVALKPHLSYIVDECKGVGVDVISILPGFSSQPPTVLPTFAPTFRPTDTPSNSPTFSPTESPSHSPTSNPTKNPTTPEPTSSPTFSPTDAPSRSPTPNPTKNPTTPEPTSPPTFSPTDAPSRSPTSYPTMNPTTSEPTSSPTAFYCELYNLAVYKKSQRKYLCLKALNECVFSKGKCITRTPMPSTSPTTPEPTESPTPFSCDAVNMLNGKERKYMCLKNFVECEYDFRRRKCSIRTSAPSISPTTPEPTKSPTQFSCDSVNMLKGKKRKAACLQNFLECTYDFRSKKCSIKTIAPSRAPTTPTPTISPVQFSCEGINAASAGKSRKIQCLLRSTECIYNNKRKACETRITAAPTTPTTFAPSKSPITEAPTKSPSAIECEQLNQLRPKSKTKAECTAREERCLYDAKRRRCETRITAAPTTPTTYAPSKSPSTYAPTTSPSAIECEQLNKVRPKSKIKVECTARAEKCLYDAKRRSCETRITTAPTTPTTYAPSKSPTTYAPTKSPSEVECEKLNKLRPKSKIKGECVARAERCLYDARRRTCKTKD